MNSTPPTLQPIRAPWRRRWREFRLQILPAIAFVLLAATTAILWQDLVIPHSPAAGTEPGIAGPKPDAGDKDPECPPNTVHDSAQLLTNTLGESYPVKD
jgi:hypothetical protein